MATPNPELILSIRKAASLLRKSNVYQWGHMGACNCGHLAQVVTSLSKAEIHRYAMEKSGDWADQVHDFCPSSSLPFDLLISELLKTGLNADDLINLERLSDEKVLTAVGRKLLHNKKEDVIEYMEKWAELMEEENRQLQKLISGSMLAVEVVGVGYQK
jgi:hypothetical protein